METTKATKTTPPVIARESSPNSKPAVPAASPHYSFPFSFSLTKDDTLLLKGIAILLIVSHNFLHLVPPSPVENEFFFAHERGAWLALAICFEHPAEILHVLLAYFGHYGVVFFVLLSGYGLTKKTMETMETMETMKTSSKMKAMAPLTCSLRSANETSAIRSATAAPAAPDTPASPGARCESALLVSSCAGPDESTMTGEKQGCSDRPGRTDNLKADAQTVSPRASTLAPGACTAAAATSTEAAKPQLACSRTSGCSALRLTFTPRTLEASRSQASIPPCDGSGQSISTGEREKQRGGERQGRIEGPTADEAHEAYETLEELPEPLELHQAPSYSTAFKAAVVVTKAQLKKILILIALGAPIAFAWNVFVLGQSASEVFFELLRFFTFTNNVVPAFVSAFFVDGSVGSVFDASSSSSSSEPPIWGFVSVWWFFALIVQLYLLFPLIFAGFAGSRSGSGSSGSRTKASKIDSAEFCGSDIDLFVFLILFAMLGVAGVFYEPAAASPSVRVFLFATPLAQAVIFGLGVYFALGSEGKAGDEGKERREGIEGIEENEASMSSEEKNEKNERFEKSKKSEKFSKHFFPLMGAVFLFAQFIEILFPVSFVALALWGIWAYDSAKKKFALKFALKFAGTSTTTATDATSSAPARSRSGRGNDYSEKSRRSGRSERSGRIRGKRKFWCFGGRGIAVVPKILASLGFLRLLGRLSVFLFMIHGFLRFPFVTSLASVASAVTATKPAESGTYEAGISVMSAAMMPVKIPVITLLSFLLWFAVVLGAAWVFQLFLQEVPPRAISSIWKYPISPNTSPCQIKYNKRGQS